MDLLQAIDSRVSRRSYLKSPIDAAIHAQLVRYLSDLNAHSTLALSFLADGKAAFAGIKSYGLFTGVQSVLVIKGPKTLEHLFEKGGYYGEQAVLFATSLGLGTCWVAGSYDRSCRWLSMPDDQQLVAVVAIGNVSQSMTGREQLIRGLVHRSTKSVDALLQSDASPPKWLLCAMASVQKAPSAANSQRVAFRFQNGEVTAEVPGDRPTDAIDLGIAKLHFALAASGRFDWGSGARFTRGD